MKEYTVKFLPQNKSIQMKQGTDVMSAAIKCGIILNASCGGDGICGKCKVIIDNKTLLACQTLVESDLVVNVPKESLELHEAARHDSEDFTSGKKLREEAVYKLSPLVKKIFLKIPKPVPEEDISDLDRVLAALEKKSDNLLVSTKIANVKHLSEILLESDYEITVTLGYRDIQIEILSIEPGDTSKRCYAFAFDIGTTTVVGQLIDLLDGRSLGTRIAFNRQGAFGSDVITRIIFASNPEGLDKLSDAVKSNIDEIVKELLEKNKVNMADVYAINFAGNMTMMHLLLKIDPTHIRKPPYTPTAVTFPAMNLGELGIEMNPRGLASFLPGVSTYVGGDIVSGVLATGLYRSEDLTLLADIGTNGEIVLGNKEWMIGSAASAGPAFEGSGLEFGMKAVKGAIEKAEINDNLDVRLGVIGQVKPKGICGSGYIDLLCQLLRRKVIGRDGKIARGLKTERIRKGESVYEFVVSFKSESDAAKDIVLTEDDIDNLKRAKGAIYSAVISLLSKVGKNLSELKKIYIAGGFGSYLNIDNSVFIGMLPDIKRDIYEFIGNSSLAGSRLSLLSHDAFMKTYEIHKNITYVDLSAEPTYMDEYVASLFFPHTDLGRFPSAR